MLAEIQRQKEEPGIVAGEAFEKAVYGDHPYGRTNDEIAAYLPKLNRQEVLDFYRSRYSAHTAISSPLSEMWTEKEIVQLLNSTSKAGNAWNVRQPERVMPPAIQKLDVKKINKNITQANIDMGHIGISGKTRTFMRSR